MQASVLAQEPANDGSFVIVPVVRNYDDVAAQVAQQVAKKFDNLVSREEPIGFGGEVKAEPLPLRRDADATDDGDFVALTTVGVEHRRLTE
jgi:hypothetical protein